MPPVKGSLNIGWPSALNRANSFLLNSAACFLSLLKDSISCGVRKNGFLGAGTDFTFFAFLSWGDDMRGFYSILQNKSLQDVVAP